MPSVYQRISQFNQGRLPEMLPLKYKAMSLNPFSFYRGTCHLFYQDLAAAPALPKSPLTWICGDLHLENFGSFKGDDRQVYFDLNDFDEAMLAPALWEVARMVTSIFVAFEGMKLKISDAENTAGTFLDTYAGVLAKGKSLVVDPRTALGVVQEFLEKVEERKPKELLKRFATSKKGKTTGLLLDDRHFEIAEPLKSELLTFMDAYVKNGGILKNDYKVVDCVFRLAGTGSIGVKRYLFLLKRTDVKGKFLFVDMKQALPSSLKPYVKAKQPAFASEAVRVIALQQRVQHVSPALLSSVTFKNESYVIKQMQPIADKINFAAMKNGCEDIDQVIVDMAQLTASAQIRSGGRQGSAIADELVAFGGDKQWHDAILDYSRHYAAKVNKDYEAFMTGYSADLR